LREWAAGMTTDGAIVRIANIRNQRGLHARAAAKFVKLAGAYNAQVRVIKGDMDVSGTSIMGLMMLAAGIGTDIELRASGAQASEAMRALLDLIERKFDEE
jgi:phosphocarrier protein HPr